MDCSLSPQGPEEKEKSRVKTLPERTKVWFGEITQKKKLGMSCCATFRRNSCLALAGRDVFFFPPSCENI